MVTETKDRINDSHSLPEAAALLTDGIYVVVKFMGPLLQELGDQAEYAVQVMDRKRLYGTRIIQLYRLCNNDVERFKYHLYVELPNQETGEIAVYGKTYVDVDPKTKEGHAFFERRQYWRPGDFWGLLNPPTQLAYDYPII